MLARSGIKARSLHHKKKMSAFEELSLNVELIRAVEEEGWVLPQPVQQDAIPPILWGNDLLVAAETGSGKTGAFGLPVVQIVHEQLLGKCKLPDKPAQCRLSTTDKDQLVLITQDQMQCKCEEESRWRGFGQRARSSAASTCLK